MLFSAQYAGRVFALEPDYGAYQELYHNVALNPEVAAKTTVMSFCISDKAGTLTMHGTPGSSMSTVLKETDKQKADKHRTEWTVECMTLDKFVEAQGIDPTNLVLKVDTEGAEKDILRQLKPWIAKYKPSMLLSMHAFAYPDDSVAHKELQEMCVCGGWGLGGVVCARAASLSPPVSPPSYRSILSYKTVLFPNGKPVDRTQ